MRHADEAGGSTFALGLYIFALAEGTKTKNRGKVGKTEKK